MIGRNLESRAKDWRKASMEDRSWAKDKGKMEVQKTRRTQVLEGIGGIGEESQFCPALLGRSQCFQQDSIVFKDAHCYYLDWLGKRGSRGGEISYGLLGWSKDQTWLDQGGGSRDRDCGWIQHRLSFSPMKNHQEIAMISISVAW
jgi:hypothetical protein